MTDELTCDRNGCDLPAFARYRHVITGEWIDVCGPCRPSLTPGDQVVAGSVIHYHTRNHPAWPAESVSEVRRPNSFKHTNKRNNE